MLSIVPGGHNGKKKNTEKDLLKTWRITTEEGDVYRVTGTEIAVGDVGDSLIVFNKGTIVFSENTHTNVSIDDLAFVQKLEKPKKVKKPAPRKAKA